MYLLYRSLLKHWGFLVNFPLMAGERVSLFATDRGLLWETGMHVGKSQKKGCDDNATGFQETRSHKRCIQWPHAASKQAGLHLLYKFTQLVQYVYKVSCRSFQYPPPFDPFPPHHDQPFQPPLHPIIMFCWLENEFHTGSGRRSVCEGGWCFQVKGEGSGRW